MLSSGRAQDDLLSKGRLATLERWLEEAHRLIPSADAVAVAEVELAFRKGRWPEAEDKARNLAVRFPSTAPTSHPEHSFARPRWHSSMTGPLKRSSFLSDARARSTTSADLRRVLWSRFITLTDLEEPRQAADVLEEFEVLAPESVEDKIRLSHGPIHLAVRWGGIREALERHRSTP